MSNLKFKNVLLASIIAFGLVATVLIVSILNQRPDKVRGSVIQGSEYHSTSTKNAYTGATGVADLAVLQDVPGTLGSVVITGAGTSPFCLFDATTTNKNFRNGKATSTIACFASATAVGTYTYDVIFYDGLILDYDILGVTGSLATSTITWR